MEKFIAENPSVAFWILTLLVGLVVWMWKRDVSKANDSIKEALKNNTSAMNHMATSFDAIVERLHQAENDIAVVSQRVESNRELCKQHTASCSRG